MSTDKQLTVSFNHNWDEKTLEICSESGYEMTVKLEEPFEVKGWRNLFESLGIFVEDE
jgi:hypothetical protein